MKSPGTSLSRIGACRRRLADQALAQIELAAQHVVALGAVAGDQFEPGFLLLALGDVEDAILGVHQRARAPT
jgi:hypothetical protein